MSKPDIGTQYDKIASWWHEYHLNSDYGVFALTCALSYGPKGGTALDVGCGLGGRMVHKMEAAGFSVTGVDASAEMIKLATATHPKARFIQADIAEWETEERFDFILSWDCLFHLPLSAQKPVLSKLCRLLNNGGILIHSFGDAIGHHQDEWRGQTFHYSSIGIIENLKTLMDCGLTPLHLERDQFPERHVYSIAIREND
jgi:SAM-dependent methyltransferase